MLNVEYPHTAFLTNRLPLTARHHRDVVFAQQSLKARCSRFDVVLAVNEDRDRRQLVDKSLNVGDSGGEPFHGLRVGAVLNQHRGCHVVVHLGREADVLHSTPHSTDDVSRQVIELPGLAVSDRDLANVQTRKAPR